VSNAHETTFEDLQRLATQRHHIHKNHDSSRPLSQYYELIGLVGEWMFARRYDLDMDLEPRPGGDGRVDFEVNGFTIDVKSAEKAYNLLREVDKPHAEILVLVSVNLKERIGKMIGWEFDEEMLNLIYPPKIFHPGGGILNHYVHRTRLKHMSLLEDLLGLKANDPA
jgi:hypothetical protein